MIIFFTSGGTKTIVISKISLSLHYEKSMVLQFVALYPKRGEVELYAIAGYRPSPTSGGFYFCSGGVIASHGAFKPHCL